MCVCPSGMRIARRGVKKGRGKKGKEIPCRVKLSLSTPLVGYSLGSWVGRAAAGFTFLFFYHWWGRKRRHIILTKLTAEFFLAKSVSQSVSQLAKPIRNFLPSLVNGEPHFIAHCIYFSTFFLADNPRPCAKACCTGDPPENGGQKQINGASTSFLSITTAVLAIAAAALLSD